MKRMLECHFSEPDTYTYTYTKSFLFILCGCSYFSGVQKLFCVYEIIFKAKIKKIKFASAKKNFLNFLLEWPRKFLDKIEKTIKNQTFCQRKKKKKKKKKRKITRRWFRGLIAKPIAATYIMTAHRAVRLPHGHLNIAMPKRSNLTKSRLWVLLFPVI